MLATVMFLFLLLSQVYHVQFIYTGTNYFLITVEKTAVLFKLLQKHAVKYLALRMSTE